MKYGIKTRDEDGKMKSQPLRLQCLGHTISKRKNGGEGIMLRRTDANWRGERRSRSPAGSLPSMTAVTQSRRIRTGNVSGTSTTVRGDPEDSGWGGQKIIGEFYFLI